MDHRPEIVNKENWPKIPEIPVDFKLVDGEMVAYVTADLGILGKWEVGDVRVDEPTFKEFTSEEIADVKAEVQIAFSRLLLRFAAVTLFERGEGLAPIAGWYEDLEETMHEE